MAEPKKRNRYKTDEERKAAQLAQGRARRNTPEKRERENAYRRNRNAQIKEEQPEKYKQDLEKKKEYYHKNKHRLYEKGQEWNRQNSERKKQMSRESYHRRKLDPVNIKHYLMKHAKARAVQKGIEFNLVEEDINLPLFCPVLKVPFDRNTRRFGYSLDRIDPSKGYIKGNVWVVSQLANAMKWDSNEEERRLFAEWVMQGEPKC